MELIDIHLRSYAAEGMEALDYAITLTLYSSLYCGAITCLQDGHRVKLENGRETYVTGNLEKALAWWHQASGVPA